MQQAKPQCDSLIDDALQWQVIWASGEMTPDEEQLFEKWLSEHPTHAETWANVSGKLARFTAIPEALKRNVYQQVDQELVRRRTWLKSLGGLFLCAGAAYTAGSLPQGKIHLAQLKTGKGEFKTMVLPDGGTLKLNADSAVDLDYSPTSRTVVLHAGEIQLISAPGLTAHPVALVVKVREGSVRAIGTAFTVNRLDHYSAGEVKVAVQEGLVEVSNDSNSVRIARGQTVMFTSAHIAAPQPSIRDTVAWTKGLIIAERQKLGEFLNELRRYRPGILRCDPSVFNLELSGVFPVADTDYILQTVANTLPIQIRQVTPYWTVVESRDSN